VEILLSDSNKHIALLALMTLLRISGESSIERLVKRISTLMSGNLKAKKFFQTPFFRRGG
jgi:hypothetical protein